MKTITASELSATEYESVVFLDCDFTDADLGSHRLVDCTFERCNLSGTTWRGCSLNHVVFRSSKLLGADLTGLRKTFLSVTFEDCKLDYADFGGLPLAKTRFTRSSLIDAGFVGTDLSNAVFEACDVSGASFRNTNLSGADLRGADGCVLDPDANKVQGARLDLSGLPGLLTKYKLRLD